MKTDLVQLLDAITGLKIVVLGEAMLDCYLTGFSDRLCPEAPAPAVTVTNQKYATDRSTTPISTRISGKKA